MTSFVVPCIIAFILLYGLIKKVDVFDTFIEGAKEGLQTTAQILPALVAILTAIAMFRASGALDAFTAALSPVSDALYFPKECLPLALMRPVSGSGALALYRDIIAQNGPDSFAGRVASVLQGSTETTFYTIAVYYSVTKVKNTRHTLPSSLTADFVGYLMSALTVRLFFGT